MDPRIREDDKSAGHPSTSSGTGLRRLSPVIPANAGIQRYKLQRMDPRIREDDKSAGRRVMTATARHSPIYWPANANPILL